MCVYEIVQVVFLIVNNKKKLSLPTQVLLFLVIVVLKYHTYLINLKPENYMQKYLGPQISALSNIRTWKQIQN